MGTPFRWMKGAGTLALVLLLGGLISLWLLDVVPPLWPIVSAPAPPPIVRIQGMSHLAHTRVQITDTIEGENDHYRGKWLLFGEVILGSDLSQARYTQIDETRHEATLRLPQPTLLSSKVNHERSEVVYIRQKTLVPLSSPQVLRDEVWRQADRKIQDLGRHPGYAEQARRDAERALRPLFRNLGWTLVLEWE